MGVSRNNGRGERKTRSVFQPRGVPTGSKLNLANGIRHGYRSGLEERIAKDLTLKGVPVSFESIKVGYLVPETKHTYHPDFTLPNGILIEGKGKLELKDRAKMRFVKHQNPHLDIRFVFMRPNDKIYKGSPTTYAAWCDKEGFLWAARVVPQEWIDEPGPNVKPWESQP